MFIWIVSDLNGFSNNTTISNAFSLSVVAAFLQSGLSSHFRPASLPVFCCRVRLPLDLCLCCCLFLGEVVWQRSFVSIVGFAVVVVMVMIQLW